MLKKELLGSRKFGFLGVGNMGQAVLSALIESKLVSPNRIWASNRTAGRLKKVEEAYGVNTVKNNEELVDQCDVIILGVKPQDFYSAIEPIASSFEESHIVISLAAGVSLQSIKKLLPKVSQLIRVMTNTPARIRRAVIGYCLAKGATGLEPFMDQLLEPMGYVVKVEEGDEFEALTVSTSSGIGFVFEFMQYWEEWLEEHGFSKEIARRMTIKTFLGASLLADSEEAVDIEELQRRVVSKKGVTAAGLDSMRELEIERLLRYSFEKAVLRDRELGQTLG